MLVEKPKRGKRYWTCRYKRYGKWSWAGISTTKKEALHRCDEIKNSQFGRDIKSDFKAVKETYPFWHEE